MFIVPRTPLPRVAPVAVPLPPYRGTGTGRTVPTPPRGAEGFL